MAAAGLLRARGGEDRSRPGAATPEGGQIIVGISQEPQNFNPIMPTIESQRGLHMAIYDDLWRVGPKGSTFQPRHGDPTQAMAVSPRTARCSR